MIFFDDVVREVSRATGVSAADILGRSKKGRIATARQMVMYLMREMTDESLTDIGYRLWRNHATIYHGHGLIARRMEEGNGGMNMTMRELRARLTPNEQLPWEKRELQGCEA